jgi:membrane protease subunit (stomatin/prohibitin family)
MSNTARQSTFFKGIYEFEDPSGTLIAAKVPASGTVDLYSGTAIVVKPSQCAIFIYKGQVSDVLFSGTHQVKTENMPVLTKLANWQFGFQSPLRCELVFVAGQLFAARRWGSPQPILVNIENLGPIPIRTYGNFNIVVSEPKKFYAKLMGSRSVFSITDLEELVQGQIVELLPDTFTSIKTLADLGGSRKDLSKNLETKLNIELKKFGLSVQKIQILSALPSKEVIDAIDAKTAIQLIGSQKEYLFYKAATSLGEGKDGTSNDPLQMMMGLMLGKGLIGADYNEKEAKAALDSKAVCPACGLPADVKSNFCSQCGKRLV